MPDSGQYEEDGFEVIRPEPKLTRLDKARLKLVDLEEKYERLSAIADPSPDDVRMLAVVGAALENARRAYGLANKRAADDVFRRNEAVDDWRAGEGREDYKKSRRGVRAEPNADLSNMAKAEKEQRHRDQKADSKWRTGRRNKGWSEDQIQAAFVIRVQEREAKRQQQAAEPSPTMENLPEFGTF